MDIFVANFDEKVREDDLKELFSDFGRVDDVTIWYNSRTGESDGFGFVDMPNDREAEEAIEKLNGRWWNGKRLKVNEKRSRRTSRYE
jgi:RNA recognition motif-containing protein